MNLSPRELQIVSLLQQGKTNKEIGQALGLSQHTVRDNMSPMFARFGVKTRTALVAMLAQGLLAPSAPDVAAARRTSDRRVNGDRRAEPIGSA